MSGVTVATISRSISEALTPASSSASFAAGRQRSESASSGPAIRRSRMPVRSRIHSSEVSIIVESSSFVTTRSGTRHPRPVIEAATPLAVPIIAPPRTSASHAQRARSPTCAVALPRPIGPRTTSSVHSSSSSSPGSTIRLKRTSSIPAKSASRPRFSSWESTATAPVCAIASTISTPGITGRPGKWPARYHSSGRTVFRATTRSPGSSSTTSSIRRNGSR